MRRTLLRGFAVRASAEKFRYQTEVMYCSEKVYAGSLLTQFRMRILLPYGSRAETGTRAATESRTRPRKRKQQNRQGKRNAFYKTVLRTVHDYVTVPFVYSAIQLPFFFCTGSIIPQSRDKVKGGTGYLSKNGTGKIRIMSIASCRRGISGNAPIR